MSQNIADCLGLDTPMVSIVVSNYNYANYLPRCIASIFAQTYAKFQCIVVDDASTDHSAQVLDEIAVAHPEVIIVRRPTNGGQSAAALDGLARASGQFVVFVDADDMLLPNAIACHVHVHLNLRFSVGFTCGDMLQCAGDTLMSATSPPMSGFVLSKPERRFQPRKATSDILPPPPGVPPELLHHVYLVDPWDDGWVWSATSAMMFRRDALRFWENTEGLADLRYSTDAFFCYGINVICGSALIDMPLAAYRIHGRNGFSARMPLNHVRNFDIGSSGERSAQAVRLLYDQVTREHEYYRSLCWSDTQYVRIREALEQKIAMVMRLSEKPSENLLKMTSVEPDGLLKRIRKKTRARRRKITASIRRLFM